MVEEIVLKNINEIFEYERNPRKNDPAVDSVANSIKEFGFNVPIVLDRNNVIICGHTRLKAAKKLGIGIVPCVVTDNLTEEQVKAYRLADNKTAELAEWDFDLLANEVKDISEIDMGEFGFVFDMGGEESTVTEDDFSVAPPEKPRAKPGEIYQLGRHKLMCGDSTSPDSVKKLSGGVHMDMLITDPPYNVDYEGKTKEKLKIQNDKMDDEDFRSFLRKAFFCADTVMRPGAVFYIWHAILEGHNFIGACKDVGWTVRQILVWNKNAMVLGRQDYQWKHEPCLYGWKEGAGHLWASDRKQTTVLDFDKPTQSTMHPTMKPIALFDYQIKNNTKSGDTVLDLFGGSGTTLMACEQNGRKCYMMEYDPKYVDVIIKRWEDFTGRNAVLIEGD